MSTIEIHHAGPGDDDLVLRSANLFDKPPIAQATERFLATPDHHLLIALADGEPAGFVSGVETTHPDKGTEMFLYELGVDDAFRGRGIGAALVQALADHARERGCFGMWVLTDKDNDAAIATYRRAGGGNASEHLMLEWPFPDG